MHSLKDFYLNDCENLDLVFTTELDCLPNESFGFLGIDGVSESNWLVFKGPRDLLNFAVFRARDGKVEIASPFGKLRISSPCVDFKEMIAFACYFEGDNHGKVTWGQVVGERWHNMAGVEVSTDNFKAKPVGSSIYEPVSTVVSMRGLHAGLFEHAIVLLPEKANSIENVNGACHIQVNERTFLIPKSKTADLVVKGKVQWGLPNEYGVFVLGVMPN